MDEEKSEMLNDAGTRLEEGAIAAQAPTYKPGAKAPLSKKAFWRVLISLELCMLAIALDFYSIPVAVPSLSFRGFGYNNSAWLSTAFLASFPIGLLVWPSLCKGFGYKFSFVVAIEAFNVASTYSATSKTVERLIALRLVAGAGAGGACGLFDMILRDILPQKEFRKYMIASWTIWAVTAVASPLMAGALAAYVYPTFCFNLHFIPGQIGYLMVLFSLNLPEPSWSQTCSNFRNFDYVGTLCLMVGTALMLIATSTDGTLFPEVADHMVMLSIFGLVLLTAFFLNQRLVPDPLLHPSLFYNRDLLITVAAAFFFGAKLVGTMYYLPHFFQIVLQDNAMISGVSTLPLMLGTGLGTIASLLITSRCRRRVDTAHIGAGLQLIASNQMVRWGTHTSRAEIAVVLALLGLGQGATMIGLLQITQRSVSQHAVGTVTRVFAFFQVSGHFFGVACFAALYMNKLRSSLAALMLDVNKTLADMDNIQATYGTHVRNRILDAYGSSMRSGWWLMSGFAVVVLGLTFLVEQRQRQNEADSSGFDDSKSDVEVEKDSDLLKRSFSF